MFLHQNNQDPTPMKKSKNSLTVSWDSKVGTLPCPICRDLHFGTHVNRPLSSTSQQQSKCNKVSHVSGRGWGCHCDLTPPCPHFGTGHYLPLFTLEKPRRALWIWLPPNQISYSSPNRIAASTYAIGSPCVRNLNIPNLLWCEGE